MQPQRMTPRNLPHDAARLRQEVQRLYDSTRKIDGSRGEYQEGMAVGAAAAYRTVLDLIDTHQWEDKRCP